MLVICLRNRARGLGLQTSVWCNPDTNQGFYSYYIAIYHALKMQAETILTSPKINTHPEVMSSSADTCDYFPTPHLANLLFYSLSQKFRTFKKNFFLAFLEEIGKCWKWYHTTPCSKLDPLSKGGQRKFIALNLLNF